MKCLKLKPVAVTIGVLFLGTFLPCNLIGQTTVDAVIATPPGRSLDKIADEKFEFESISGQIPPRSIPTDEINAKNTKNDEPFEPEPIEIEKIGSKPPKLGRSSGRWVIPDGATEYGVEFGFAPDIATWMSGPKYYDIEDRGHILGAVRWGKILGTRAFVTYSWAVEIIPINIALNNEVDNPNYLAGSVGEPRRNREHTWGVGINPASFRFIFFPQYRLRPQLGAGFGVVRHHSRVPTVEGTKMNFQVDFQIGGQYMLKENKALNFGYRYYHFSNLYLFNFNPGYNVNMFFVGYSVFK